jgi:hypothetical protein
MNRREKKIITGKNAALDMINTMMNRWYDEHANISSLNSSEHANNQEPRCTKELEK